MQNYFKIILLLTLNIPSLKLLLFNDVLKNLEAFHFTKHTLF